MGVEFGGVLNMSLFNVASSWLFCVVKSSNAWSASARAARTLRVAPP